MKKNQNSKKVGIAEEIDILKQRQYDRKNKRPNENQKGSEKLENGKGCDAEYENLIRKKKIQFNQEPEGVRIT